MIPKTSALLVWFQYLALKGFVLQEVEGHSKKN